MDLSSFPKKHRKEIIQLITVGNSNKITKEKERVELKTKQYNLAFEHIKNSKKYEDVNISKILEPMELTKKEKEFAELLNIKT